MFPEVIATLRAQKPALVDALVTRITTSVPHYGQTDVRELRRNVEDIFEDSIAFIESGDDTAYVKRVSDLAESRVAQGFSPAEVLQALLVSAPVLRDALRSLGPRDDPAFAEAFDSVEAAIHALASTAGALYVEHVARQLKAKNDELYRLNQRLLLQEESLSLEVAGMSRAMENAQEFLRCTIDSLSSGLMAVDARTRRISLYTSRAEQILGIPAERALGHDVVAALGVLTGIDIQSIVNTVLRLGRLPLMRLTLELEDGRRRDVAVRGQRVFGPTGDPKATVVVLDDVTREEMLFDSIARFLPRETATRVMALGNDLPSERRTVGVLIARLSNFGTLAEALDPESLHEALDAFVRVTIEAVVAHGGFVDKVALGHAIALFTTVGDPEKTANATLRAAQEFSRRMQTLDAERVLGGEPRMAFAVGLEVDEMWLAPIGNEARSEFAAIGDAAVRAELLATLATPGQMLVGAEAARLSTSTSSLEAVGERAIPGRSHPLEIFKLSP